MNIVVAGAPLDSDIPTLTDAQIDALVDLTFAAADEPIPRPRGRWYLPAAAAVIGSTVLGLSVVSPTPPGRLVGRTARAVRRRTGREGAAMPKHGGRQRA